MGRTLLTPLNSEGSSCLDLVNLSMNEVASRAAGFLGEWNMQWVSPLPMVRLGADLVPSCYMFRSTAKGYTIFLGAFSLLLHARHRCQDRDLGHLGRGASQVMPHAFGAALPPATIQGASLLVKFPHHSPETKEGKAEG